ncbi:hypothetical protein HYW84_03860 [Candidatus Peregrinibacteria bacterium]|nr:hypothetical protein [Candidatus Peregrinibacteria bacterium]
MTDMHPHWQSTSDDDQSPQFASGGRLKAETCPASQERRGSRISIKPASRLPAAIVGISIFTVVSITVAGGWQALTAQIGNQGGGASSSSESVQDLHPIEIHIGSAGFQPTIVTVKPGQQIIWINDQFIPHIITSQTLRDGSGAYLNTPAIFPGDTATFTVGSREPDRQHDIASTTDQTLLGAVIVKASGAVNSSSSSSRSRRAPFGNTDGVNLPSGEGRAGKKTSAASKPSRLSKISSSAAQSAIFQEHPVAPMDDDSEKKDGSPATLDVFAPHDAPYSNIVSQDVSAPETPATMEQPNTGPGLWAVCFMSIAVMWGATRKYFRQTS